MAEATGSGLGGVRFGAFRLVAAERVLFLNDQRLKIGDRALDLLVALVGRAGEVLSKTDLMQAAWPGLHVEEATLRAHIAALRKVLGDGVGEARYVANIAGRGYCFVAALDPVSAAPSRPLPQPLRRMIAREAVVTQLLDQVADHRLVTIAGPGGIGKTTVATAVAAAAAHAYPDGVHFVDLAPISDPEATPSAFAASLGIANPAAAAAETLAAALKSRRVLLVVDNCEHLIETACALVETILNIAQRVDVLATSREPLGAEGESIHQLAALSTPPPDAPATAEAMLAYESVQLFVDRARAADDRFRLADEDAALVGGLCRRLDGLPLAIELAAARAEPWGLAGLAREIDGRLLAMTQTRRGSQDRHRTLATMLDWSLERLPPEERAVLDSLASFPGRFAIEPGLAVAGAVVGEEDAFQAFGALIAKSLVAPASDGRTARFRLLGLTRAYILMRREPERARQAQRRHAEVCLAALNRAEAEWPNMARSAWIAAFGPWIDDVRTAIDWAFSDVGDPALGVRLTAAAVPLSAQLSLMQEFRPRVEAALAVAERLDARSPAAEVQLNTFLGTLRFHESGSGALITAAYARTVALSEQAPDVRHDATATLDLFQWAFSLGDYPAALKSAEHMELLGRVEGDAGLAATAARQIAQASHFAGDLARGRAHAERILAGPQAGIRLPLGSPMQMNRQVSMRIILARTQWIEGLADQARATAAEAVEIAADDLSLALCQALALAACPIAIWRGDVAEAKRLVARLRDHATASATNYWLTWARALGAGFSGERVELLGAKMIDAVATCDWRRSTGEARLRAVRGVSGWCAAEVFRAEGERARERQRFAEAAQWFDRAVRTADAQGAIGWRLRAETSRARLRMLTGGGEPLEALARVREQLTEGLETADVRAADAVLSGRLEAA